MQGSLVGFSRTVGIHRNAGEPAGVREDVSGEVWSCMPVLRPTGTLGDGKQTDSSRQKELALVEGGGEVASASYNSWATQYPGLTPDPQNLGPFLQHHSAFYTLQINNILLV